MMGWKKLAADLPRTLLCLMMIGTIGIGIAHPEMMYKSKIKQAAHAFTHLVNESIRAV